MASYKNPSFQDRMTSASKAKQDALDRLKAKPTVDPVIMEERRLAWEAQEEARVAQLAAKSAALAKAKAEKAADKAARAAEAIEAAALKAARLKPASEADMKAARDARYAARQARK